jgi:hypothetical protein
MYISIKTCSTLPYQKDQKQKEKFGVKCMREEKSEAEAIEPV